MISNNNLTKIDNYFGLITVDTGNPQHDLIINMVSYFLQFIFMFNFLIFILMLSINTPFK